VVILTPGVLTGDLLQVALSLVAKDGRLVCTAMAPLAQIDAKESLFDLGMSNKAIMGSLFGSASPAVQIPWLLQLYEAGRLPLDGLITREYKLDDINQGYEDMAAGRNIRGALKF
jgi:S-(hydroxymethyl)glutathione dehydrogenase/alcohol dehydrogenase